MHVCMHVCMYVCMYIHTHIHTYTGLDPASRRLLWRAIKRTRASRAVFLTTHSMEEAENLCDRLGIFVDGELRCIGNPKVRVECL